MTGKLLKGGNYLRAETSFFKDSKRGKLFKGRNYIRADTIQGNTVYKFAILLNSSYLVLAGVEKL